VNEINDNPGPQQVKTVCPYCGVGCGMILHVEGGRVTRVSGDKEHPANFGSLCTKGSTVDQTVHSTDRLAHAQRRRPGWSAPGRGGHFERVPMDSALQSVADNLRAIIAEHGPDAVALYVSGQLSTESQYVANKLCKGFFKTNNIDSNSRLCMASAASGYKLSLGADAPPGHYEDFESADCFFVIGSNMADCHPILHQRMRRRMRASGAKLIVVDPRRTATAADATLYLPIKPGSDLGLLNGLLHLLAKMGRVDQDFIDQHTDGWDEMAEIIESYPPERAAEITELPVDDLIQAARLIGESAALMSLWTMGLNQSARGTWQTNAICNLHLATGQIGRVGSGPFSLTGQPNAMGGREVGYMSGGLPGHRSVHDARDRAEIEALWGVPEGTIRPRPGFPAVDLFKALESGEVKALWIIGSNPAVTMPNRSRVLRGLERAQFVVVQDAYHPTETSRFAHVLLPGAVWAEAEGTMTNSSRMVTFMPRAVLPPADAMPDWEIICEVARRMGFGEAFPYRSASEIFDEIRRSANPRNGYDVRGMNYSRLSTEGTLTWPLAVGGEQVKQRYGVGNALRFPTPSGRARFWPRHFLPNGEMPDEDFPFILTTGRMAHQWHTRTKTGKVSSLNKLNPGPFLEMNISDAVLLDARAGDRVRIVSRQGSAELPARPSLDIRPGCCWAPMHWNDLFGVGIAINEVTSENACPESHQPELKFCPVRLEIVRAESTSEAARHAQPAAAF
jgi:sulfite reductase (NADPH) flavoprotein alpha-component